MNSEIDWDEIAESLGLRLYSYFHRRGFSHEASDLTQDCLIRLFDKVQQGQFDPLKGNLAQLAFGIAHYVVLEQKDSRRNTLPINEELEDQAASLDSGILQNQTKRLLRKAVLELPMAQQEVLSLLLDEQLALREIADILSLPENTIKSHIHRAKESLRLNLKDIWEYL